MAEDPPSPPSPGRVAHLDAVEDRFAQLRVEKQLLDEHNAELAATNAQLDAQIAAATQTKQRLLEHADGLERDNDARREENARLRARLERLQALMK